MNDRTIFLDYCFKVCDKLVQSVNGKVTFEAYVEIDVVIFIIEFKDFVFKHGVNRVTDLIYKGDSDSVVADIKKAYRAELLRTFFKDNKRRGVWN